MSVPSPERARAAVRRLTPLRADELVELGRGTESVAYLVDGEWVAISGIPLTADTFDALGPDEQDAALASLAEFLRALHAFPLELARAAGVREERDKGAHNRRQRSLHRDVRGLLSTAEIERLDDTFTRYERDHFTKVRFFTTLRWRQDLVYDIEVNGPVDESLQGLRDRL
jgi:hypothetical protein